MRWGTALHDRFMLPHFCGRISPSVIADLKAAGLPVELEWFVPHFEFRFPRIGAVEAAGVELELRQALEPWHVLGEEGTAGGTARYVDDSRSSGCRCACVGRPATATSSPATGARCRSRRPGPWARRSPACATAPGSRHSCLHPTIQPHVPLTFDIVDTWTGRSLGGCRYHARTRAAATSRPLPVNAYEAEGRRLARFERMGHTAGSAPFQAAEINPEYPFTLDLRR